MSKVLEQDRLIDSFSFCPKPFGYVPIPSVYIRLSPLSLYFPKVHVLRIDYKINEKCAEGKIIIELIFSTPLNKVKASSAAVLLFFPFYLSSPSSYPVSRGSWSSLTICRILNRPVSPMNQSRSLRLMSYSVMECN